MEALLSHSFSNISSRDAEKIRKGLRQLDVIVAQICLSSVKLPNRPASVLNLEPTTCKTLHDLVQDAAFLQFFELQEGFQCNGTPSAS